MMETVFLRNSGLRLWRQFLEREAEGLGAALEIAELPAGRRSAASPQAPRTVGTSFAP